MKDEVHKMGKDNGPYLPSVTQPQVDMVVSSHGLQDRYTRCCFQRYILLLIICMCASAHVYAHMHACLQRLEGSVGFLGDCGG